MNFRSVSLNLTRRFRQIFFVCRLLFVVEPNQIFSRTNNLTFQTRKTVLSKEVFVIQRGKKKYQHFLPPVNHLNQRKSPSALLVSNEIETDFFSSSFPPKSREVPEVADLSIVCGWGGVLVAEVCESWGCLRLLSNAPVINMAIHIRSFHILAYIAVTMFFVWCCFGLESTYSVRGSHRVFYKFYLTQIVIIFDAHIPIFTIFLFT